LILSGAATFSAGRVYFSRRRLKPLEGAPPMKRILLSTSLALALSSSLAIAQQPDTTPAPTAKVHHHHTRNPQREAARLSKKLNLSADQTAKLEPILVDRDNKIAALTSDTSISPVAMKQQIRAIRQQTRQQLATVLTPDQLQQLKAHHHRRGQESPDQAQPQPNPQSSL
jgi:Spy/CpxP family protein refolding chaperone